STVSITASLSIIEPPVIITQPAAQSVVQGSNATFTVVANGTAMLGYQWRFNGNPIPGASSSSYTKANVQPADAGNYSVQITNAAGSTVSITASLSIIEPPVIITQPAAQSVVQGSNATFTVVANGTAMLGYQWRFNGNPIPGASSSSYTKANVQPADAGNYSVQITNAAGSTVSITASLSIIEPPVIITQPAAQSVVQGSNGTFTVVANGTAMLGYQWRFNGNPIPGASSSSYTKANVQPADAGNYSVQITNAAGSTVSTTASLSIIEPPVIITQPAAQSVVQGSNATFTVVANGTAMLGYQWRFNGNPIPGASSSSYTKANVQPADAGNYSVQITNAAGSTVSITASLSIIEPPVIITQPAAQSVVQGSNATFTVVANGTAMLGYQWRFNGNPIPGASSSSYTKANVHPADAGNYSVQITNAAGSTVSITASLSIIEPPVIITQPAAQSVVQGSNA